MESAVPDILKAAELKVFDESTRVKTQPAAAVMVVDIDDNELYRLKMGLTLQTMGRLK